MVDAGHPPTHPTQDAFSDRQENLAYVRRHVHPAMMDLAFNHVVSRPYMKISICIALYLVLALLWMPGLNFGHVVDADQTVASKPAARRKILEPPPEKVRRTQTRKPIARKVPMPDSTPMDPEPVIEPAPVIEPDLVATEDWEIGDSDWAEDGFRGDGEWAGGNVHLPGEDGLVPPTFTKRLSPKYPDEAVKIKLQGYVILEAILRKDGQIDAIQVVRGLSKGKFGFEREAVNALKKWEFLPGKLHGEPVDVRMTIKIDFILY